MVYGIDLFLSLAGTKVSSFILVFTGKFRRISRRVCQQERSIASRDRGSQKYATTDACYRRLPGIEQFPRFAREYYPRLLRLRIKSVNRISNARCSLLKRRHNPPLKEATNFELRNPMSNDDEIIVAWKIEKSNGDKPILDRND